jgi:hypothetical protein
MASKDRPLIIRPGDNDDNLYHIDKDQKDKNNNTTFTQMRTLTWNEINMLRDSLNVIIQQVSETRSVR